MRKNLLLVLLAFVIATAGLYAQKPKKQLYMPDAPVQEKYKVDTRIDNMSYWRRMASLGLVPVAHEYAAPFGKYTGSKLTGKSVMTEDSPDVPVTTVNSTQSENSIFVNPNSPTSVLNSNNSTPNPVSNIYGANDFWSTDAGTTWDGHVQGAGGSNSGDPTTAISLSGRYYVGYIHSSGGQGVSYSDNQGVSWTPVLVAPSPSGWGALLDKNHMWIDNSISSPYEGNLYDAWTNFGGSNDSEIEVSRSTNDGVTWSSAVNVSSAVNAGSHNQGVNLHTGPNGEVYAIWAIYDSWPSDEKAIGIAKSFDGGITWQPATRIINNIRGIRNSATGKNMRVNAFPSMAVDISNGPNQGTIYVVWTNIGIPGINTGNNMDIYMIKSTDEGVSWSSPVKVNQDDPGFGKQHYFPWITCDATNGNLSVVYYDDRNVSSNQCEVYVSNSIDGGESWEDLKVSDVSFTPQPISGLADGYFGDYLGIHAHGRWVYPVWTDNRTGYAMTYVSAFQSGPPPNQPWVIYQSHAIKDASGNNNGLMDFGETLKLDITMENIGDQPSASILSTLSTESAYITITDATEDFGDFAVGEVKSFPLAFELTVASNIPDGEIITFTLTSVDAADSTFISNFNIEAYAPSLQAGNLTISDPAGNGNGRLDPGETATLSILTLNPGNYISTGVTGILTSSSPYVTVNNPNIDLGDIGPGILNAVIAQFEVSVNPQTPVGHSAGLNYTLSSSLITINKTYNTPVGLILEDYETGDYSSFEWQFAGSSPWTISTNPVFEGLYSSASGNIGNNQSSEMKVSYEVMNPDTISFYIKVSSETDYDFLSFYIDNTLRGQWSGDVPWQQEKFAVDAGQHLFRWVYSKDVSVIGGSDKAWVDFIVFPAPIQTIAFAGPDVLICGSETILLNGMANHYVSTLWTTSGDGTFADSSQLSTFYTPGVIDLETGSALLTLTATGPDDQVMTDDMNLNISLPAVVNAGEASEICAGSDVQLDGSGENYTTLVWTTSGTGTFSDTTILNPVYSPGAEDIAEGAVEFTLTGQSAAPCFESVSITSLTIFPLPTATMNGDTAFCIGATIPVSIDMTGTAPWVVEVDGYGTITSAETPYVFEVTPEISQQFSLLSVTDANGCSGTATGTYQITVNTFPTVSLTPDTSACSNHIVTLTALTEGIVNYLWTPGNYTTQSISVDTVGFGSGSHSWTVQVTNENNCVSTATANVTFNDCTGIDEFGNKGFSVFPNPSDGNFTVRFAKSPVKPVDILISDASDKVVYRSENRITNGNQMNIRVPGLAPGVYILKLAEGNEINTLRLIIR